MEKLKRTQLFETLGTYRRRQPHIGDEDGGEEEDENNVNVEGGGEYPLELDDVEDEEKGLTEDELRRIQKGTPQISCQSYA